MKRLLNIAAPATLAMWLAGPLSAQCLTETVFASDGMTADGFGSAVAIDDDILFVGAWTAAATRHGLAYVFDRTPSGWTEIQRLEPALATNNGDFGWSIDVSGDWAFIGSPGAHGTVPNEGVVHVFHRTPTGWIETARMQSPLGGASNEFGYAVTVDGDRALVGEHDSDSSVVIAYERSGLKWRRTQVLEPLVPELGDLFGESIVLDGDTAFIGAPRTGNQDGAVYAFEYGPNGWAQAQKLTKIGPGDSPRFGTSLAFDAGRLAVGGPGVNTLSGNSLGAVDLYENVGGQWTHQEELLQGDVFGTTFDDFGASVSLAGDTLLVGACEISWVGHGRQIAYAYQRDTNHAWNRIARLLPPQSHAYGDFATRVFLDGATAMVQEPSDGGGSNVPQGRVHLYSLNTLAVPYCFCPVNAPCANEESSAGCTNSTGAGARLTACGSGSIAQDDLVLRTESLPASELALTFFGAATSNINVGDGTLCVAAGAAGVYRLPVQDSGTTGMIQVGPDLAAFVQNQLPPGAQFVAGATWNFQTWFRDPGGACANGFNFSNALAVTLAP